MKTKIVTIPHTKKIQMYQGLFDAAELEYLNSPKRSFSYGWKAHQKKIYDHGHWNNFIVGAHSKDEILNIDYQNDPKILLSKINSIWKKVKYVFGERRILRTYFNGYTYGTEGYIHNDSTKEIENYQQETILIYCNNKWDPDWAGETQFLTDDNEEIVYSTLPKPNRVICFDSSIPHVARAVSRSCFGIRTILAFKTSRYKINKELCFEFVRQRTEHVPHSRTTFFEHLKDTYTILEEMGMSEDVCMAGLFHAIYGTDYFKHQATNDREEIKKLIGDYAEDLVFNFCTMKNRTPEIISNAKSPLLKNYHLACIEYANLKEQARRFDGLDQKIEKLEEAILSYGFHRSS